MIKGESLTSYIQRVASDNFVFPSDIWGMVSFSHNKYHQSSISCYLDINPYLNIDLNKCKSMLLCKDSLDSLTLIPLLQKLNIPIFDISKNDITNIKNSIFYSHRRYCPKCLKENGYYKLIWQIRLISYCELHNIKLVNECCNCNIKILLLPRKGTINICSFCNSTLSKAPITNYLPSNLEISSHDDWSYLCSQMKKYYIMSKEKGATDTALRMSAPPL
jgi:hypothetical protein